MISETRERFLRAIIAAVPAERIAEIHFFPPIKQGGVESGVAVIAAGEPPTPTAPAAPAPAPGVEAIGEWSGALAAGDDVPDETSDHPVGVAYPVDGPADVASSAREAEGEAEAGAAGGAEPELTSGSHPSHDHPSHEELADAVERAEDADELRAHDGVVAERVVPFAARSAPSITDDIPTTPVLDDLASGEEMAADLDAAPDEEGPARRFTVFTARYRLVLKGPDRGKWEASAVAEADAPLLTVEAVVRGVQRRSGDVDDPERMSGDEVRAELARMDAAAAALRGPAAIRAG